MQYDTTKLKDINLFDKEVTESIPLYLSPEYIPTDDTYIKTYIENAQFNFVGSGDVLPIRDNDGKLIAAVADFPETPTVQSIQEAAHAIYKNLPAEKTYALQGNFEDRIYEQILFGFGMAQYEFSHKSDFDYKQSQPLFTPQIPEVEQRVEETLQLEWLARDLTNRASEDLTPTELANSVVSLAREFNASSIDNYEAVGTKAEEDLDAGKIYAPLIYSVGKAAKEKGEAFAPRFVTATFGPKDEDTPSITIVGKGITLDTGGLKPKDAASMSTMHTDMSGSAHALAAALNLAKDGSMRVTLAIPIAENAIGEKAYPNGSILEGRNGKTVHVTNTDAEGRLILADAHTIAAERNPDADLILNFATLTGASIQATGGEAPSVMGRNKALLRGAEDIGDIIGDPIQTFDFEKYCGIQKDLFNGVADLRQVRTNPAGGQIFAGLFLEQYIAENSRDNFVHIDMASARTSEDNTYKSKPMGWRMASELAKAKTAMMEPA